MIGTEYAFELQLIGATNLTIPQGENEEFYFLITIKNHDYVYPIIVFPSDEPLNWSKDKRIYVKHIRAQPFYVKLAKNVNSESDLNALDILKGDMINIMWKLILGMT